MRGVMRIEKHGRFFGLYDATKLVCVTVYLKGAIEVARRLESDVRYRDKLIVTKEEAYEAA